MVNIIQGIKQWGFASKSGQCLMLNSFQEDNILIWDTYIRNFTANLCHTLKDHCWQTHKYLSFMSCACIHAALDLAFSSLYRDEVHLVESEICSVIAAASMLQLVSRHTPHSHQVHVDIEPSLPSHYSSGLAVACDVKTFWFIIHILHKNMHTQEDMTHISTAENCAMTFIRHGMVNHKFNATSRYCTVIILIGP